MFKAQAIQGFDDRCALARGLTIARIPGVTEQAILYIQPCASVQGRVNCELRLGVEGRGASDEFFEFNILSKILRTYGDRFAESRVSTALGAARIEWRGKKILIFRDGRIVIREALDGDDVQATLEFLSKLLAPSIRCGYCGQHLADCAAGLCRSCLKHAFVGAWRPAGLLWRQVCTRFEALLVEASKLAPAALRGIERGGQPAASPFEELVGLSERISRLLLDFLVSSVERRDLVAGLALLRASWSLESVVGALCRLVPRVVDQKVGVDKVEMLVRSLEALMVWIQEVFTSVAEITMGKDIAMKRGVEASETAELASQLDASSIQLLGEDNFRLLEKLGGR